MDIQDVCVGPGVVCGYSAAGRSRCFSLLGELVFVMIMLVRLPECMSVGTDVEGETGGRGGRD